MKCLSTLLAVFFVVGVLALNACKSAKPGDACSGKNLCTAPDNALLCVSGSYVSTPCKGPDGCRASPFACDFRENAAGSVCYEPEAPNAPMSCTADKQSRIRCLKGKVERDECDGPRKCYPKSETTMGCDQTLHVGGACLLDGDWCAADGDWLQCHEHKLVVASKCRGQSHCKPFADTVACDTTVGEDGDPCVGKMETCSVDHKSILTCTSGHLHVESTCPPNKACDSTAQAVCK